MLVLEGNLCTCIRSTAVESSLREHPGLDVVDEELVDVEALHRRVEPLTEPATFQI